MRTTRLVSGMCIALAACAPAFAQESGFEIAAEWHDVSRPLSELAVQEGLFRFASEASQVMPVRKVTPDMRGKGIAQFPSLARSSAALGPLSGSAPNALSGISPHVFTGGTLLNFEGIGPPNNGAPSDSNGAVGATQYVQWVNTRLAVFNKSTGAIQLGPVAGNTLFAGFVGSPGADACRLNNNGDPLAQYDKLANRWVLSQFAWLSANTNTGPYYQCVAVSTTSDATGPYNRYVYASQTAAGAIAFNDYGKVGVWPDAYYFTFVLFTPLATGNYLGPQVCGYDRVAMLAGAAAVARCKDFGTAFGPLLPSDVDGTTAPPANSPNFLVGFDFNGAGVGNILQSWKFSFTTNVLSARTDLAVTTFIIGCPGTFGGACVKQPVPGESLDSLADRPMYRLAYRNYGSRETLVFNHTVQQPGAAANGPVGVRWYELRDPNGAINVYQQGTFAPDTTSRWMGSVAMDKRGNMAVGYSASSTATFPGVRYTGRLRSEPRGFLESEATIVNGGGVQVNTFHRWGDYSSLSIDPTDDCTFWYTQQYIPTTGSFTWHTRISNFKFNNCS